ncbi:hypothetical protein NQ314_009402 [Rhamnusium bicolor]|uniref:Carboxylesterase type B domain-containing protein n=1 Tax=Rhamnusium bicolor TaxID=1586634 RepID=A0AAV8Y1B0_9CUCU|nr:hypothetical protein NQ314_009402 [Rhamnusium bicolor]
MADPIVRVEQGKIKGKIETDIRGGTFYSFKGIPYGKPPIGELRFKAPEPAENWTGIRDCTKDGSPSFQVHQFYNTIGSEDCLHLNVYTPGVNIFLLPQENQVQNTLPYLKPVMVWIHGGALINGSNKSSIHGPEFILAEDVVLVVINYRLGLLGFLSCEDVNLNVPGNAAFKDMVLALKWIKQNISNFLGDPNNVTIFGESVGAASVDALVLSPMAKGLFHKAILQSLSVITPSFCGKTLKELATDMDFKNHTEREIFDILKHSPAEKLLMIQDKLEKKIPNSMRKKYVGLIIEKPSDSAFLTISPLEIIKSGKYNNIPMIMGYNSMEGLVPQIFSAKWKTKGEFVPHFLNLTKGSTAFSLLAEKVVTHYFGNKDFSKEPFTDVTESNIFNKFFSHYLF